MHGELQVCAFIFNGILDGQVTLETEQGTATGGQQMYSSGMDITYCIYSATSLRHKIFADWQS